MKKQPLSLTEILNAQALPLNEKQIWGLAYSLLLLWYRKIPVDEIKQTVIVQKCLNEIPGFEHLRKELYLKSDEETEDGQVSDLRTSEKHQDGATEPPNYPTSENVYICVSGCVFIKTDSIKTDLDFNLWIQDFGFLLYKCLDFNVPLDSERLLSYDIDQFITRVVDFDKDNSDVSIIQNFIQQCLHDHDSKELRTAMIDLYESADIIQSQLETLEKLDCPLDVKQDIIGDNTCDRQQQHKDDRDIWMKSWHQVTDQIRKGVQLRHVDGRVKEKSTPTCPQDRIVDDIQNKRYKLRPIEHNNERPIPVELSSWDQLMEAIRQFSGWNKHE